MPVGVVLEGEDVGERHALGGTHDGARRPQAVAHGLDGEGLLEVLQEAMGLELVQIAALGTLGLVELDGLEHERPQLLCLVRRKVLYVFDPYRISEGGGEERKRRSTRR
jgi:hypothetical protein